jgi:hypothetical protein
MAQKRMFSLQIVDTDAFLDMPVSCQLLYFHLVMRADDEGFIGNPKKILRLIGGQDDDLKILFAKRFLLNFESGVVVIKHWLVHNTIRMDRFNQTTYQDEKSSIITKDNRVYSEWQPLGNQMVPQVKLSKDKLSKVNLSELGEKTPTPAQEAREFFKNKDIQLKAITGIAEKYNAPPAEVQREINKFISYWTELNKTGNKERWEQQPSFEVKKRIVTWLNNIKTFSKPIEKTNKHLTL